MKKILIFRIGALGDVLMTTPLLQALHTQEPEAQIDYLTGESNAVLLQGNPCVHECITMPDDMYFRYKILSFFQLIFKIRKKKYDTIYVLDKHWIFSVTAFLFGISERRGFYRDRLSRYFLTWGVPYGYKVQHEVEYNLSLLETVSPDADMHLFFHVSAKDEAFVQEYLKTQGIEEYVVVINDGGNNGFEVGGSRMLPNDIFQTLLQKLASKYPKILLLAGPNMKSYYDRYTQEENIINVAGLFKIPQSIVLLKYAKKVYTTDCGPMHMAATVNEHIVGFFGPTNPQRKAPLVSDIVTYWNDEDLYDAKYEIFGKIPSQEKKFFSHLDIDTIA